MSQTERVIMNITDSEVEQIEKYLGSIQAILNKHKLNKHKLSLTVKEFEDLAEKGAIFYLGHDTPLENATIEVDETYGFVKLNGRYECYSNGCCFKYSLPPHSEKIRIEYNTEIPNKSGYKY